MPRCPFLPKYFLLLQAEEDEAEFKAAFEEVQAETLNLLSDTQDQNEFELIERMCDTFDLYKAYFARGAELIAKLEPTYEKYKVQAKKVRRSCVTFNH